MKILFRGWTAIPHSYAIVNCFQLLALYKRYKSELEIYIQEMEYFRNEWQNSKKWIYNKNDIEILENLKKWNGEKIDLVYSITYPYDITPLMDISLKIVPKCVFYTSEFAWLNEQYFKIQNKNELTIDVIKSYINNSSNKLYFTAPSVWSAMGLKKWYFDDARNRIITHGVNPDLFKMHTTSTLRKKIRTFYKVQDDEVLLINIGGMTQNKGIELMLAVLHKIINIDGNKKFKLLLKAMGDLYTSQQFLQMFLERMKQGGVSEEHINRVTDNIIFADKTLSYEQINNLYNAADYYISPYLAEGFNLTVLEALCSGLPVIVPTTGSTKEYIEDIASINDNVKDNFIHYVESNVLVFENGMWQNRINTNSLYDVVRNCKPKNLEKLRNVYVELRRYIIENYSWDHVAELLFNYFKWIIQNESGN